VSQYPRIVLTDVWVYWDAPPQGIFVRHGTVVDIPPGSKLETAYGGPGNLSAVVPPRDPRRSDELGATTFSKAALAN
jgi:hypothetical protein